MKKYFVSLLFSVFIVNNLSAAGSAKVPDLSLSTPSETSRLIVFDWFNVKTPEKSKFGLYRVDKRDKTYSLICEVNPDNKAVLDTELQPPLSNYFYRMESVRSNRELPETQPIRITDEEMADQISSCSFINKSAQNLALNLNAIVLPFQMGSIAENFNKIFPDAENPQAKNPSLAGHQYPENTQRGAAPREKLNDGIYIGAISFSGNVNDITKTSKGNPVLIPLDPAGKQELLENLSIAYVPSNNFGTALYYAEHRALANLSEMDAQGILPQNLESVTFITFTDGVDTSSTDADFAPIENRDFRRAASLGLYRNFINSQLRSRTISGKRINAWSIGIRGRDVINENEFVQTLDSLSANEGYYSELDYIDDVEANLCEIADGLNIYTPQIDLTFSTPAYPIGTLIRISFDAFCSDPEFASYYIDAKVSWSEGKYMLTNLKSEGIKILNNAAVNGRRNNTAVEYTIRVNNEFVQENVRQWYKQNPNDYEWMANSEFVSSKMAGFSHDRKSAIVYLVLDNSSSLRPDEINKVRKAISVFVDRLYSAQGQHVDLYKIGSDDHSGSVKNYIPKRRMPLQSEPVNNAGNVPMTIYIPENLEPMQTQAQTYTMEAIPIPEPVNVAPQVYYPQQGPRVQVQQAPRVVQQAPRVQEVLRVQSVPQAPRVVQAPRANNSIVIPLYNDRPPERGFWIQAASYRELTYAQRTWKMISDFGFRGVEIFEKVIQGTPYFRVKLGPYNTRYDAEYSQSILRSYAYEFNDSFIVEER
ncbi:MAG: hypothetical protein Ta2G_13280 [Termitinemataceae bacterium]|nr:MAG: hypothetical protein Ta2G_13280 [Termitinemataceae bacterium]